MKLHFTIALPGEKGGVRQIRTLSLSGVATDRRSITDAEVRAVKYATALWGKPESCILTDADLEWGETK